jgi:hypothetical protein
MKKFSTIFVSLAVLLGCLAPVPVFAQGGGAEKLQKLMANTTPEQRARFENMWMKKDLQLSDDQATKVGQINLSTAQRMQSIFNSPEGKFRKFRQAMRVRDAKDSELQKVLTGQQFMKYKAKKEEMWQKMHAMK